MKMAKGKIVLVQNFMRLSKNTNISSVQLISQTTKKGTLQNSFCYATITMIPKQKQKLNTEKIILNQF